MRKLVAVVLAVVGGPATAQDSAAYTDQASQQKLVARTGRNVATIAQDGNGNNAEAAQNGLGNNLVIRQSGTNNSSVIRQGGYNLSAESAQAGSGLGVIITQNGAAGDIRVQQVAPGASGAIIQRSGPGAVTVR